MNIVYMIIVFLSRELIIFFDNTHDIAKIMIILCFATNDYKPGQVFRQLLLWCASEGRS